MPKLRRPTIPVAYGVAVAAAATAVAARWGIDPWLGDVLPFLMVYPTVAVAVWVGGVAPACLTAVLGYLGSAYAFAGHATGLRNTDHLLAVTMPCAVIIALGGSMRRTRLRAAESQRLLDEQRQQLEREAAERQRTADELSLKDSLIRAVLDGVPTLISYIDRHGRYQLANRQYQHWFGRQPHELTGHHIREIVGTAMWELLRPRVEAALGGETVTFEMQLPPEFGHRAVEVTYTPDFGEDGVVRGFVVHVADVTSRKQADVALRESEQRFQSFMDHSPAHAWIKDAQGRYVFVNRAFESSMGWRSDEWRGKTDFDLFPEKTAEVLRANDLAVLDTDTPLQFLETVERGTAAQHILSVKFPMRGLEGERLVGGKGLDVTEQKRAETALRDSEERFRGLAEGMPHIVWEADVDGYVHYLNRVWYEYVGTDRDLTLGLQWLDFYHPDDREAFATEWGRAAELSGAHRLDLDVRLRRRDGVYRWFRVSGAPVRDVTGALVKWVGTCTDVQEQRELLDALRDADRRKDEFLATLAHELRNPLAPISNALQILRLTPTTEPHVDAVRDILDRQVRQLVRLVDDLLDVSRITRNKLTLRMERITVAAAVQSAVETTRPAIEARGHVLNVVLPSKPVFLMADLTRLAQIVSNLLSNAAKYTDPGGHLDLIVEAGDDVVLRVRDTGVGIAAEHLPGIFEMFSQVAPPLERSHDGLGVGLALVRGLVELHGGRIEAHSDGPNRGSEFVVRLPRALEATARPVRGAQRQSSGPPLGRRILVVDDNRDSAESLALMLRLRGHDVRTAHDGLEALAAAEAFGAEVVLLDIGLPKLNGYEVARRIRQQAFGRHVLLVAQTGWAQEEDKRRAREAGFDRHLTKPVDASALERLLEAHSSPAV